MNPVHETDLSVQTEIEELPSLPEFPAAARISEFVAQLEELMRCMNPMSYWPCRAPPLACRADPSQDLGELQGDVREESSDALL